MTNQVALTRTFIALLVAGCISVVMSQISLASYDNPQIERGSPSVDSAYNNGSSSQFTPRTGVGNGAFDGQYTWAKVYVPLGGSSTVRVQNLCDAGFNVGSSVVEFRLKTMTSNEDLSSAGLPPPSAQIDSTGTRSTASSNSCDPVEFNISSTKGIPSIKSGHTGYRVFALWAKMISPTGSTSAERYFRFQAGGSGVRVGLADGSDFVAAGISSTQAYYSVYSTKSSWNYATVFAPKEAPTCGSAASTTKTIGFYDADNGLYQPNMHVNLYSSDRHSSSTSWTLEKQWTAAQVQGGPWGTSGTKALLTWGGYNRNKIYKLVVVGSHYPNTIQIKLPFDQIDADKELYPPCPGPGWRVSWADHYVLRSNDNVKMGLTAGELSDPDNADAPQPGQSFRYINDARNTGSREITNLRWSRVCNRTVNTGFGKCYDPAGSSKDRWLSSSRLTLPQSTVPSNDGYDPYSSPPQNHASYVNRNTQNIAFDRGRTGFADDTFSISGAGVGAGGYINGPRWVWDSFNIGVESGGQTKCVNASFHPSQSTPNISPGVGTTSWSVDDTRIYAPQLCVNVPHYYNLQQSVTVGGRDGVTVQQGTNLQITGTVSQAGATGSRNHTNSQTGKEKGVLQFRLDPGEAEPSVKTGQGPVATSPIDWCNGRSSNLATCTKLLIDARVVDADANIQIPNSPSRDNIHDVNTSNLPVGTKMCYATYSNHPRHINEDDYNNGDGRWSYSSIECATVVKSPKVQFLNTDVTVGRYRTTATDCQPAANAPIITTGTPESRRASNLYGSWVEYGAFASGNITGFGSGAAPSDSNFESTRLTFGNTPSDLGEFLYGKNCLADPFGMVKDSNSTNLTSINTAFDSTTGDLRINELGDSSKDKTGYVSINKSVNITPRALEVYTADVSVQARAYLAGSDCPKISVTMFVSGLQTDSKNLEYCDGTDWQEKTVELELGSGGYVGPEKVVVEYINDYSATADRNIDLGQINVKFNNNNTQQAVVAKDLDKTRRLYDPTVVNVGSTDPACHGNGTGLGLTLYQSRVSASTDNGRWCFGVEVLRSDLPNVSAMPVPPNVLDSNFEGFNKRNMIIYSKKTSAGACSASSDGNIAINQDILYKKDGFANVLDLPRIIFMADCNITIADNVAEVNATLIAGDAIKTCSTKAESQDECNRSLIVRGGISANRLLLWRTHGADLTQAGAEIPAETFDISPSQVITGYNRGLRSAKPTTVYEVDLPPRY